MTDPVLAALPHPVPAQERRGPVVTDAETLLAAVDADADALADALHDGALQSLVVARYAADAAVRGGSAELARDAVQDALVALRRAVWLMRPRGADDLRGALHELSGQLVAAGRPALDLRLDADVAAALPASARVAAYRFVQAATGDAPAPAVHLAREGGFAALTVTGSLNDCSAWAARAAALGGRLDTERRALCLLLPLPDTDPEGDR